jgi:hypothetical protein
MYGKLALKNRVLQRGVALLLSVAMGASQAQLAGIGGSVADSSLPQPAVTSIDPVALKRAHEKLREAVEIVDVFAQEAKAAGLDDGWRMTMITNLMKGSRENFRSVAAAKTLNEARIAAMELASNGATASTAQQKTLGTVTGDLTFSPRIPCRKIDTTQPGGGGPFNPGQVRTYFYTTSYGAPDCNLTYAGADAKRPAALAVNVSVLALSSAFAGSGYLAAYPAGGTPDTAWITYKQGDVITNAGVMPIDQATGNYSIFTQFGVHVKLDVFGVFSAPAATALECVQTEDTLQAVSNSSKSGLVYSPSCTAGYTAVSMGCYWDDFLGTSTGTYITSQGLSSSATQAYCQGTNFSGASRTLNVKAVCCRVPGR